MDSFSMLLVFYGPAVLGLGALVGGIELLRKGRKRDDGGTARTILGILCLLVAFGVGTCYALFFTSFRGPH